MVPLAARESCAGEDGSWGAEEAAWPLRPRH